MSFYLAVLVTLCCFGLTLVLLRGPVEVIVTIGKAIFFISFFILLFVLFSDDIFAYFLNIFIDRLSAIMYY